MTQVTYLSLLVGDGDNIAFMRGGRRGWMRDRLTYCQEQVTDAIQSLQCNVHNALWANIPVHLEVIHWMLFLV